MCLVVSVQVVRDADYKAPRARRAALRRTASGGDPFAEFNFLRPPPRESELGGGVGRDDLDVVEEDEEEDEEDSQSDRRVETQMQWEFEVRDGWEAFGPADQRELALAFSKGQKQIILNRPPTDGGSLDTYSYRLDLQKMTQVNLRSGRQRKLRRLPAGRSPDALDAAADAHIWAAAEPELISESTPGQTQPPTEEFQGWVAEEGEQEAVDDTGDGSEIEPQLVLLSSTAPVVGAASQTRSSVPR